MFITRWEKAVRHIQWKISAKLSVEENIANLYIRQMEEHPAVFEEINETAKKYNTALSYAKQGSDDLAMIQVKKVLSITPNFVNAHLYSHYFICVLAITLLHRAI